MNKLQLPNINTVFTTSRDLPMNYIERDDVDNKFINALDQNNNIVIYGSSKQGKTSLRKKQLSEDEAIIIMCSNKWDLSDLQTAILKRSGLKIHVNESQTTSNTIDLSLNVGSILNIGSQSTTINESTFTKLSIDPSDTNDIVDVLTDVQFDKYIILEDFHYLPTKTQMDFSIALKAFQELSNLCFIIIGVWLEDDKITSYNGDLSGRLISINADIWCEEDLNKLFTKSEQLLNIKFNEKFKRNLITKSNGNIFIVQKVCFAVCQAESIYEMQPELKEIGVNAVIDEHIKSILDTHNSRFITFLTEFSAGFGKTDLELYKWILYVLISAPKETLSSGIFLPTIRETIKSKHPDKFKVTNGLLLQSLSKSLDLQLKHSIKPIIFEYDSNKMKLKVVDKSFILWREQQDINELYDYASLVELSNPS
ncbi:hypothetical protein [Providencia stuartii]|uniref:hypothetical protein n=1 Tax=Providencia stuartii TaxID=588 RepID=UPI00300D841E